LEKVEKEEERMNSRMNKYLTTSVILAILAVVAVLTAMWATSTSLFPRARLPWEPRPPPPYEIPGDIELFYTVNAVVSTINVTLAIILFALYAGIYRKTRSEFTVGLIVFSLVFLLNALASNPMVIWVFGFQPYGLGPFALLPGLFTFGALLVLLYLCLRY
jgi:hypothetical protein